MSPRHHGESGTGRAERHPSGRGVSEPFLTRHVADAVLRQGTRARDRGRGGRPPRVTLILAESSIRFAAAVKCTYRVGHAGPGSGAPARSGHPPEPAARGRPGRVRSRRCLRRRGPRRCACRGHDLVGGSRLAGRARTAWRASNGPVAWRGAASARRNLPRAVGVDPDAPEFDEGASEVAARPSVGRRVPIHPRLTRAGRAARPERSAAARAHTTRPGGRRGTGLGETRRPDSRQENHP